MTRRTHAVVLDCALVCVALLAGSARGDEIVTRSGTRYEGRIVSEDATHYVIETAELGTLRLPKSDVASVNVGDAAAKPGTGTAKPADPAAPGPDASAGGNAGPSAPAAPGAAPVPDAAAAKAAEAEEAARLRAEDEARDAAARIARRKAATLKRRVDTDPNAPATAAVAPARTEQEIQREQERRSLGGADLAATKPGTQVITFEPTHPWSASSSAILVGRRSWARFDMGGTASATLIMTVAEKPERLTLRLTDVQRHVPVQTDASRERLFEGVDEGDWVRLRLGDGATVQGRFVDVTETAVRLRVPEPDAAPNLVTVDVAKVVQVDGMLRAVAIDRMLNDLQPGEPVGLLLWPDAKEEVGRFVDRTEDHVRLDSDGDGTPDVVVAATAPIGEVRRIPATWREAARTMKRGTLVRVRGGEEYDDARVERVFTAPLASVTAYAVSVELGDGCAVVPFDSMVAWEEAPAVHGEFAARHFDGAATHLPVLPGTPAADARKATLPKGVSFVTDGEVVTHVYVAPPYERDVLGLRVGADASETLPECEMTFGTEVFPKSTDDGKPTRELISESVDGLRVTAYVNPGRQVSALEITRR